MLRTLSASFLPLLPLLALAASSCTDAVQPRYEIQIVTPLADPATDQDHFAGAERVVLELSSTVLDEAAYTPTAPITLDAKGIDVGVGQGVFRVRVLGAGGTLVAFGQTPAVELDLASSGLRIFVQKPRSFGRSISLPDPRTAHIAVATRAVPTIQGPLPIVVPFFGFGLVRVPGPAEEPQGVERFSEGLLAVNTLTHDLATLGIGAGVNGTTMPAPRIDASAISRTDDTVLVFGGIARTSDAATPAVTSQVDVYRVWRDDFASLAPDLIAARVSSDPLAARSEAALAGSVIAYAFGGRDDKKMALDSVVQIDTTMMEPRITVLPARMMAARAGHTATTGTAEEGAEMLVFGGAEPGKPVAELFVPRSSQFQAVTGDAGGGRRDHAAVVLPDGRILIVGGVADDGTARGDALTYDPRARALQPANLALRTPRSAFTAFVIADDLVIAGGRDSAGTILGTAEVFNARSLERVGDDLRVRPRARARACVIPEQALVFLVGGDEPNPTAPGTTLATAAVEIYQPTRM